MTMPSLYVLEGGVDFEKKKGFKKPSCCPLPAFLVSLPMSRQDRVMQDRAPTCFSTLYTHLNHLGLALECSTLAT